MFIINFLRVFHERRSLIFELIKKDFISRYLGSYLGVMWAFVQPAVTILIYWFIFQVGFKSTPINDFPFILWFMAGIIPWFYFSDSISTATNSIMDNAYLVKKVVFPVSVLPIIKIVSALFVHLFFIAVLFVMFLIYGYDLTLYNLQFIYYSAALFFLLIALSWITSTLIIFLKDIGQIVMMSLQFLFWLTPIMWNLDMVPEKYQFYFKLNPLYYIVEGYRESFIYGSWFWEHPWQTLYFWGLTITLLIIGVVFYKKLRPHFADVL